MGYDGVAAGELLLSSPVVQTQPSSSGAVDLPSYTQLSRPKGPSPKHGATSLDDPPRHPTRRLEWLTPAAIAMDNNPASSAPSRLALVEPTASADPSDVLLVDLGGRSLLTEDLEKALLLWTRPTILIAARNSLERLPTNVSATILCLDLSWNRLTLLEGFAALPNLRELDVSHNSVQNMLGLHSSTDLRILRISHNRIRRIEGLHQLKRLEEADFSHNTLRTKADVRALSLNAAIRRLRIEGNPFCVTGVQHGAYQIAMQHLLPGMSLLDGKPPSVLSTPFCFTLPLPSPPRTPPPGTETSHHNDNSRGGPQRTRRGASSCSPARRGICSTRERFMGSPSLDYVGDLSAERRWCDSAVLGRSLYPLLAPKPHQNSARGGGGGARGSDSNDGHGANGQESCIKVTTRGGGPTVAPGSYADIFLAGLRKERSRAKTADHLAPAKKAAMQRPHQPGQNAPPATRAEVAPRRKRCNPIADDDAAATTPASVAPTSLLSYHGLSRAERGAARRQAWSQARREGTVGDLRGGVQQQQRRKASVRKAHIAHSGSSGSGGGGGGDGDSAKSRRRLAPKALESTRSPHGRASVSHAQEGASHTERCGLSCASGASRIKAASVTTRRSRQPRRNPAFEPEVGAGGGSSSSRLSKGTLNRQAGSADARISSSRGWRPDGGDSWTKPGATRLPGNVSNARRRQTPSTAGRGAAATPRDRGGTRSGGGGGKARGATPPKGKKGGDQSDQDVGSSSAYRFRTTLGQRSTQQPRPLAPVASPWTPREDAKPWGWDADCGDEVGDSDDDVHAESNETNSNEPYAVLGVDGGGVGVRFVSPLSTEGLLHRIASSRSSAAGGAPSSAVASSAPATTPVPVRRGPRAHQRGAQPNRRKEADLSFRGGGGDRAAAAATTSGGDDYGGRQDALQRSPGIPLPSEQDPLGPPPYDMFNQFADVGRDWSGRGGAASAGDHGGDRQGGHSGGRPRGEYRHRRQHPHRDNGHRHHRHQEQQEDWRGDETRANKHHRGVKSNSGHWKSPWREGEETSESLASVIGGEEGPEMVPWAETRGAALNKDYDDEHDRGQDQLHEDRGRHLERTLLYRRQGLDLRETEAGAHAEDDGSPYDLGVDDELRSFKETEALASGRGNGQSEEEKDEGEVRSGRGVEASGLSEHRQHQQQHRQHEKAASSKEAEMVMGERMEEVVAFEERVMDMLSFMVGGPKGGGGTSNREPPA